jgi:hypothetical protein
MGSEKTSKAFQKRQVDMEHQDGFQQDSFPVIRESIRIPFLRGRPERDGVIDADDLANLRIALHTAESLDDFFAVV